MKLALAGKSAVVHFAGHALTNEVDPEHSRLILSPEPGRPSSVNLFAHELRDLNLSNTRLVVLSACQTGSGPVALTEGVLSLARPFLEAGARSVVASLWDIDDNDSVDLLTLFHTYVHAAASPADALRKAQAELMSATNPRLSRPRTWASFNVIISTIDDQGGASS